jgi:flavin reductase (DIM6/NTAB) family NADH-FMN oxidoreductase RutF
VVTAVDAEGAPVGLAIGSFTSVSLEPPLVAFLPDKTSSSWPKIRLADKFCVNVIGAHQEHVCRRFATKLPDKFQDLPWRAAPSGSPIIEGVVAWIDCDLEAVHEAGDHYIVLGRVRELTVETATMPLIFFQGGYGRFSPLAKPGQPGA